MKLVHWLLLIPALAVAAWFASRQLNSGSPPAENPRSKAMLMPPTAADGLLWLKTEFHLGEPEYVRIRDLHEEYLPGCQERCAEIGEVRDELFALIQKSQSITPEIKATLEKSAKLRARCHELMLEHFYKVAAAMPPDAAKRYMEWVTHETLVD
jgi:hypothetical protein